MTGVRGGEELQTYQLGQVYAVQENAWMDARVWKRHACELLKFD